MRIDSSGNVGIGTDSPQRKLHVESEVRIQGTYPKLEFVDTDNNPDFTIIGGNAQLQFYDETNATSRMNIDTSGKVGIGTETPATSLHVLNASDTQIRLSQTGEGSYDLGVVDGDKFAINRDGLTNEFVMSAGNVGIGTSSPARKLTVQGGSGDNLPARIIGGSGTTKSHIEFQDASTTADYKVTLGSIGDGMSFQAGGSEAMRIDS